MIKWISLLVLNVFVLIGITPAQISVNYTINTSLDRTAISPYIYGNNALCEVWSTSKTENIGSRRMGGNRMTGYNWENNNSNAGSDYGPFINDDYVCTAIGIASTTSPGAAITAFHDVSLQVGTYSLFTIQAAGYVARDRNGTAIALADKAPSLNRLCQVVGNKGSAFSLSPNTSDNYVYTDEMLNFIINKYGTASGNGIKGYSIDNEPDLWNSTHARIHPSQTTCQEVVNATINYGRVVKSMDPDAEVFGPVSYGYSGFRTCQGASDWNSASFPSATYPWFLDAYLAKVQAQSAIDGKRLLDVLDIHWYSENRGLDNSNVLRRVYSQSPQSYDGDNGVATARMQAPRSFWDPTFIENSWIATYDGSAAAIQLIPTLLSKISTGYPGTKLAITEYDFGAEDHISGGIATADALGIFGKYGVYMANYWGTMVNYVSSAFKLFRNYDGSKSTFGNLNVRASTNDVTNSSIYASVTNLSDGVLHIIVLNKNLTQTINGSFAITSSTSYKSGTVYGFNNGSTTITSRTAISSITGNSFTYSIPALTALHIVLTSSSLPVNISSFSGNNQNDKNILNWKAEGEKGIKIYEVEKLEGNDTWKTIGVVDSKNNPQGASYSFIDNSSDPVSYYRLKISELSGASSYSEVISILKDEMTRNQYHYFPNPFNDYFKLKVSGQNDEPVEVTINDISGKSVFMNTYYNKDEILLGSDLPAGLYLVEVKTHSEVKIFKIIKNEIR